MECDVCGASWPAPVTQTWRFKLDNFILEGLREHGLLACLWCLAQLSSPARASFYFYESQQLFYTAESFEKRKSDAEIDLLAVVDGTAYLCEAKSSSGSIDLGKFVEESGPASSCTRSFIEIVYARSGSCITSASSRILAALREMKEGPSSSAIRC
jgi:hypothetical protein